MKTFIDVVTSPAGLKIAAYVGMMATTAGFLVAQHYLCWVMQTTHPDYNPGVVTSCSEFNPVGKAVTGGVVGLLFTAYAHYSGMGIFKSPEPEVIHLRLDENSDTDDALNNNIRFKQD